ncbi:hypothetical protein [Aquibacillus kalidii]|uniref:hypothetical protein n=1 Tax=Aquibacillus kalidii TaxID=2762597 RepID=UPI0016475F5E|nr:hypothetical protein [Aquibacillus kalidii]
MKQIRFLLASLTIVGGWLYFISFETVAPRHDQHQMVNDSFEQKQESDNYTHRSTPKVTSSSVTNSITPLKILKQKYKSKFKTLESNTNDKLNELLESAYKEFRKQQQRGNIDYFGLYSKYKRKADKLESLTDEEFQHIYEKLQAELVENGYSKEQANVYKQMYQDSKKKRKNNIMDILLDRALP